MQFEIEHKIVKSEVDWKGIIVHAGERHMFPPKGEPFYLITPDGDPLEVRIGKQSRIRMTEYFNRYQPNPGDTITFRFRTGEAETESERDQNIDQLRKYLADAVSQYPEAKKAAFPGDGSMRRLVEHDLPSVLRSVVARLIKSGWLFQGSVGKGTWAAVPWVAVLNPEVTSSVSENVYIVFLVCGDGTGVFLTLNQGTGGIDRARSGRSQERTREEVLERIGLVSANKADPSNATRFDIGELPPGALKAETSVRAGAYEKACILSKYYSIEELNSPETSQEMLFDLKNLVSLYKQSSKGPDFPRREPRAWIFQCNPDYFDLRGALQVMRETTHTVHRYGKEIRVGDVVYFWESGRDGGILGTGEILTDPALMPPDKEDSPFLIQPERYNEEFLRVRIRVDKVLDAPILRRDLMAHPVLSKMSIIRAPQGTNFSLTSQEAAELKKLIRKEVKRAGDYTLEEFVEETGFSREEILSWKHRLERKKHVVFQGPPGTGKTYVAERLARLIVSNTKGYVDAVQFHPAYAYEDFVQGIRPIIESGMMSFHLKSGRFLDFCSRAAAESTENAPCVLIIDEINRAHLSRVFGELMYLLEYRDKKIPLAAGGDPFGIPSNVYLIGTMNTADRSIALVDHALRRRFSFVRLRPAYEVLGKHLARRGHPSTSLVGVLRKINAAIGDANYEVGISFFMRDDDRLGHFLPDIWIGEIEPYLEEFFYDQPGKVEPFRWKYLAENDLSDWVT